MLKKGKTIFADDASTQIGINPKINSIFTPRVGSRERLRSFSSVFLTFFIIGTILSLVLPFLLGTNRESYINVMTVLCAGLSLFSGAVYFVTSSSKISDLEVVIIGFFYVNLGCLAMATAEVVLLSTHAASWDGISGMCIWLVLFPVMVPIHPKLALAAAIIGASTIPVSYSIGVAFGIEPLSSEQLVKWFLPPYFCAGLSFYAAKRIHKWEEKIVKIQEELQELGSYRLESLIAEGGMGKVWKASHKLLPRDAAIKIVSGKMLAKHDQDRVNELLSLFEKEAKAISTLESPHTVSLFDYGINQEGCLYYVMELLKGYDLASVITKFGPQPVGRVVHIISQACKSLEEAHSKKMIHRDIKPGNIFLCKVGVESDFVKVLDFGLVSALKNSSKKEDNKKAKSVSGTPGFIAPELLKGEMLDSSADIFALGCVAYWLVSGHPAYNVKSLKDPFSYVNMVPERLSVRARKQFPDDFEQIIQDTISPDKEKRPNSAAELRILLENCSVADKWREEDAELWWKVHT